jgi:hypothetical protein
VRAPVSSACIATPFNGDGSACQGGAIGTPFFLFTDHIALGGNPSIDHLFADAYQPDNPITGSATPGTTSAALTGSINPQGAAVNVAFQFGATAAYGQMTPTQTLKPSNSATAFAATISGLAPATMFHYRAVAFSDFGTFVGQDQVFTTSAQPSPPKDTTPPTLTLKLSKSTLNKLLRTRKLGVSVSVNEACKVNLVATTRVKTRHRAKRTVALAAAATKKVTLGRASVTFTKAGKKKVSLRLSKKGRNALAHLKKVKITVTGRATDTAGNSSKRSASRTFTRKR